MLGQNAVMGRHEYKIEEGIVEHYCIQKNDQ